ncbi:ABC transporter ATP-binding protein [Gordonia sp. NPDC003376]
MAVDRPVVEVTSLTVNVGSRTIVDDVSFSIGRGEILAVVGQSGSGKTTVGMALLGYVRHGARITGGEVVVRGTDVGSLDEDGRRALRGKVVAYVPQDPRASLNPALTIRRQLAEVLDPGPRRTKSTVADSIRESLEGVGLPSDDEFLDRYPHQLSGGQLQRVGIAMATVARPPVLVFDEPTTGLDVTTQRRVLDLVRGLCSKHGIAGLYVTHDLAVVADLADTVLVMKDGSVQEYGPLRQVFTEPTSDYTRRLLAAAPDLADVATPGDGGPRRRPAPILDVTRLAAGYRKHQVLHDVSFQLFEGECLAIVGESGSGKTTLSRALIGLHPGHTGEVSWWGTSLPRSASARTKRMVKDLQYVFQSPFTALNPRMTVGDSLRFAHTLTNQASRRDREVAIGEAMDKVGLPRKVLGLLPNRLSGGERQRAAIARALVTGPSVLICDEITASLDVLIQETVIDLLGELKRQENLALLFVTHDLALVGEFADRVLVLDKGRVVEQGPTVEVLTAPRDPYTRRLLDDAPSISAAMSLRDH